MSWRLPLLLFVLTLASTTFAGAGVIIDWDAYKIVQANWSYGFAFSGTLMSILVAHEMGHWLLARHHGVEASLPHFIPLPPPFMLGTLGAVITMETQRARRNALLDIGAAGPIAGFLVAVPLMLLGISLSKLIEVSAMNGPITFFGDSILTASMVKLLRPEVVAGFDLEAHPVFIGAWAGFLVTAINLLPMGQLDGGHVLYAVAPDKAERFARRTHRALVVLGCIGLAVHGPSIAYALLEGVGESFEGLAQLGVRGDLIPLSILEGSQPLLRWTSYAFLVWAVMGKMTGFVHPPVTDPSEPLTTGRRVTAATCLIIGVLTFMPSPAWVDGIWKPYVSNVSNKRTTAHDSTR